MRDSDCAQLLCRSLPTCVALMQLGGLSVSVSPSVKRVGLATTFGGFEVCSV